MEIRKEKVKPVLEEFHGKQRTRTDLTGEVFGWLTVLREEPDRKKGHRFWRCRCQCGKETVVEECHLKSGHTKSCGCYRRKIPKERKLDLTGQRYGRLLVIGPAASGNSGMYWDCICDCGKRCVCNKESLRAGSTRSCGCLREEQRKKNMASAIHFQEGTCVERIACQRTFATNTSGHRGVYRRENGKWRASIGFKGKIYNLGTYGNFEDAVSARLEAERQLYEPFLKQFREQGK